MSYIDFVGILHKATERDYIERVVSHDKAQCAELACQFGEAYWDGDRSPGYGGYGYDGRWRPVIEAMVAHYGLTADTRILDVGCGKGFQLYEFTRALPGVEVTGIDISEYAIENAKPEVKPYLKVGNARDLPFEDNSFDFVFSITTLHNLFNYDLYAAVREIERVGKGPKHITVESYRNEREKANLLYWQLTCRAFHTPEEWEWLLNHADYTGDFGLIFFE
ncbi:MAG: class I SAM-dependent methyltransferase [Rhodospirillales bacterium]|nr:class I SAM-dependent methyltransferase [Rhodospirillales bacterium]